MSLQQSILEPPAVRELDELIATYQAVDPDVDIDPTVRKAAAGSLEKDVVYALFGHPLEMTVHRRRSVGSEHFDRAAGDAHKITREPVVAASSLTFVTCRPRSGSPAARRHPGSTSVASPIPSAVNHILIAA